MKETAFVFKVYSQRIGPNSDDWYILGYTDLGSIELTDWKDDNWVLDDLTREGYIQDKEEGFKPPPCIPVINRCCCFRTHETDIIWIDSTYTDRPLLKLVR